MKKGFYNLLKGKFLISDDAFKNWRFIFFISALALIVIASSHRADKKVYRIAQLNNEVKEIKSEFVDVRMIFMQAKMETRKQDKERKERGKTSKTSQILNAVKNTMTDKDSKV